MNLLIYCAMETNLTLMQKPPYPLPLRSMQYLNGVELELEGRWGDHSKYISANRNDNMNMYKIIPHATPVITQQEEKRCASNTSN